MSPRSCCCSARFARIRRLARPAVLALVVALAAVPAARAGSLRLGAGAGDRAACAGLERAIDAVEQRIRRGADGDPARIDLLETLRARAHRVVALRFADRCVGLNQIQVLGTHNSYHIEPDPFLLDTYQQVDPDAIQWQYTHAPLDIQFENMGVRQIELDVFADPDGGLYASPLGLRFLLGDPDARIPELEVPGFKVLHVQELDFGTTCFTFVSCLETIRAWSDAHPYHLPITVLVEVKDDPLDVPVDIGAVVPPHIGPAEFDALDAEIRSVFPPDRLITPDDVRGDAPTLGEAVATRGWPPLGAVRGRVLFALDNEGTKRAIYREGRPSLEGRVLFTGSLPGEPDGAFAKRNDPIASFDDIRALVSAGMLVRTRADANTLEARANDPTRRDTALASGAQLVSSDYPVPDPRLGDYQVRIPDGAPGRCNPVNGPPGCRSFALELAWPPR